MNKIISLDQIEIDDGSYILDVGVDIYHDEVHDNDWPDDFSVSDITYIHIKSATRVMKGVHHELTLASIPDSIQEHFKEQVVVYLEYNGVSL